LFPGIGLPVNKSACWQRFGAEQFLDSAYILAALEQMRSEPSADGARFERSTSMSRFSFPFTPRLASAHFGRLPQGRSTYYAMTDIEAKVVAAWQNAACDSAFAHVTIYRTGTAIQRLGLVHHFGRRIGTIISVLHEPSSQTRFPTMTIYFPSELSDSYTHYNRQFFIDTLDDWEFFGPDAEKPV
jgi:hypothetical protein